MSLDEVVIQRLKHGAAYQRPTMIVVHAIAEYISDPESPKKIYHCIDYLDYIKNSAHSFITPSGVVISSREDTEGAYHAKNHNTDSLGVEFMVPGVHDYNSFKNAIEKPYLSDEQFMTGVKHVRNWVNLYRIKTIVRHCDIDPRRKMDPGMGFPWERFQQSI